MRATLLGGGLVFASALAYGLYTLSQLAPVGTAYAAKILCTGVYVSGRTAQAVIDEDILADVHPLLTWIEPSVDLVRQRTGATFLGLAKREAQFQPGLGCTLALGDPPNVPNPRGSVIPVAGSLPAPLALSAPPGDVDGPKLMAAVDEAFAEPNPDKLRRTRAVVVLHRGRVIAERYAPGFAPDMPLIGWSMTKSVTAALLGVLVQEGKLALDSRALMPEWRGQGDRRADITLEQLLRMTSGLRFEEDYVNPLADVTVMLLAQPDAAAFAAAKPLEAEPGTKWSYSSGTSAILGGVLRNTLAGTGEDYRQFPPRALFAPLGMQNAVFEADTSGTLATASFMHASAHDWARFGQFLLQDGVWNGKRLLPEGWVRFMSSTTEQSPRKDFGAHLWVKVPEPFNSRAPVPPTLPADAFHAVGHEGQFVTVVPSRELVVVRLGLSRPESNWDHESFLARVLAGFPAK